MSELVDRLLDARKGYAPHPFRRIDRLEVEPIFSVRESDLNELLAVIGAEREKNDIITDIIKQFIRDNGITSPETIHQCDWVIENAYAFIEELCDAVGYLPEEDE